MLKKHRLTVEQRRRARMTLYQALLADIDSTDLFESICDDAFEEDGEEWATLHEALQEYARRVVARVL